MLGVAAWRDYNNVKIEVQREVENQRDLLHQHALSIFLTHDVIAKSIISRISGMDWNEIGSSRDIHDDLADTARQFPQVNSIWLTDASGVARASSMMFPVPSLNAFHREYYKLLRTTDTPVVISRPFTVTAGDPEEVFNVSFRLTAPDGSFFGFVGTAISTKYFKDIFAALDSNNEPGQSSSIFRDDGAILVRMPPLPAGAEAKYNSDVMDSLRKSDRVSVERISTIDGIGKEYAYRRVGQFPVYIGRGISESTVDARWRSNLVTYISFFVSAVVVLLTLAFYGWRRHKMVVENAAQLEALVEERTRHLNNALAEKTAFFREVHHRVKNNLQIISSLARLQGTHGGNAESLERRIQAMALVHEMLYSKAEATNLDLSDYIPRLCSALEASVGSSAACTVDATKAFIDLERAIPFALILSETVTNAFKHGRRDGQRLNLHVVLKQEGDELVLEVGDNGPGLSPTAESSKGFGMRLIKALATQLEGTSEFVNGTGMTFRLRFPARRRREGQDMP